MRFWSVNTQALSSAGQCSIASKRYKQTQRKRTSVFFNSSAFVNCWQPIRPQTTLFVDSMQKRDHGLDTILK